MVECKEQEPVLVSGLALFVVHYPSGALLSIREKIDKPSTLRCRGQRSVPVETRKNGECTYANLLGALAEGFDDRDRHGRDVMEYLKTHLFRIGDPEEAVKPGFRMRVENKLIQCHYGILMYDGDTNIPFRPFNHQEVDHVEWKTPQELLDGNIRAFARLGLVDMIQSGFYRESLLTFCRDPGRVQHALDNDFSIRRNYFLRELHTDTG